MEIAPARKIVLQDEFPSSESLHRPKRKRSRKLLLVLVAMAFTVGMFLTLLKTAVNSMGVKVVELQEDVVNLQQDNQWLILELGRLQSLEHIEETATKKLQMVKPSAEMVEFLEAGEPAIPEKSEPLPPGSKQTGGGFGSRFLQAVLRFFNQETGQARAAE